MPIAANRSGATSATARSRSPSRLPVHLLFRTRAAALMRASSLGEQLRRHRHPCHGSAKRNVNRVLYFCSGSKMLFFYVVLNILTFSILCSQRLLGNCRNSSVLPDECFSFRSSLRSQSGYSSAMKNSWTH
jgi:hypothetical protein